MKQIALNTVLVIASTSALAQTALLEACNSIKIEKKRLACLTELEALKKPEPVVQPLVINNDPPTLKDTEVLTVNQAKACLDTIRKKLKDPESGKVLAIIGTRGMTNLGKTSAWIQYKATNDYGGYVTSSMLCSQNLDQLSSLALLASSCVDKLTLVYMDAMPNPELPSIRYKESQSEYIARAQLYAERAAYAAIPPTTAKAKKIVYGDGDISVCNNE